MKWFNLIISIPLLTLIYSSGINCVSPTLRVLCKVFPEDVGNKIPPVLKSTGMNRAGELVIRIHVTDSSEDDVDICIPAQKINELIPGAKYKINLFSFPCSPDKNNREGEFRHLERKKALLIRDLNLALISDFPYNTIMAGDFPADKNLQVENAYKSPDGSIYLQSPDHRLIRLKARKVISQDQNEFRYIVTLKNGQVIRNVSYVLVGDFLITISSKGPNRRIKKSQVASVQPAPAGQDGLNSSRRYKVTVDLSEDKTTAENRVNIYKIFKHAKYDRQGDILLIKDEKGKLHKHKLSKVISIVQYDLPSGIQSTLKEKINIEYSFDKTLKRLPGNSEKIETLALKQRSLLYLNLVNIYNPSSDGSRLIITNTKIPDNSIHLEIDASKRKKANEPVYLLLLASSVPVDMFRCLFFVFPLRISENLMVKDRKYKKEECY